MSTVRIIISATARGAMSTFAAVGAAIRGLTRMASRAGQIIGKAAPFALLAGKITLIVAAATAATGVLGNLLGIVQLAAPAAAAGALAFLGVKLALNGIEDALKAGLDGDIEKFEKALSKLAPQAAEVVRQLVKLRDTWKPLARDFQGRVFQGAAGELEGLNKFIKPIADRWLPRLAMRFAEVRHEIADGIARYAADGRLEGVWRNVHSAVSSLLGAVKPLAQAFGDVLEVASPRFAQLSDDARSLAQRFADWIRQAKESGKLGEWLDKAIKTFGQLKDIATNVATTITGIMSASSDEGSGMLDNLVDQTKRLSDWVNSGDGQEMIDTFAGIAESISKAGPMLQAVMYFIGLTGDAWKAMAAIVTGVWDGIKAVVAGAIGWILGGYEKVMRAAAAAADAMGMDGLAAKLRGAADKVAGFAGEVNNYLNGIKKSVDITVTTYYRQVGRQSTSGDRSAPGSGLRFNASGGHPRGLSWVGEYGPELVDFGAQGRVFNNGQSRGMYREGEISSAQWRQLMAQGWRGNPNDGMEAIYQPGHSGLNLQVSTAPGANQGMAQLVTEAIRRGWVQLKVTSGGKVVVA